MGGHFGRCRGHFGRCRGRDTGHFGRCWRAVFVLSARPVDVEMAG
jgi:hypothetical protein